MKEGQILVMLKAPERGKVKTRLARSIGAERALQVYQHLLDHSISHLLEMEYAVQLWWDGAAFKLPAETRQFPLYKQTGPDLGIRMLRAFAQSFEQYQQQPTLIIGTDCPNIFPDQVADAFTLLQNNDVVIGPSMDGGYYLLGMTRFYPSLFKGIDWSTPAVYTQTIKQIEHLDLRYAALPVLNDIDTYDDLLKSDWYYHLNK